MEILDDEILLTENELLYSIWTKPTLTFKYILKFCPKKNVTLFLALSGIVNAFERSNQRSHSLGEFSISFIIMAVVFGGIFGVIFGRFYAALLGISGRWIKGKSTSDEVITVVAWASVPTICSLILLLPKYLIFGNEVFYFQDESLFRIIIFFLIAAMQIALSIWTLVILVRGIELVQEFSTKKAVLNLLLSFLVILIPIAAIVGLVIMFR